MSVPKDDRVYLVATQPPPRKIPKLETQRGSVVSMEQFDEPPDDFKEYLE